MPVLSVALRLQFQPQVRFSTWERLGVEVPVRWQRPVRGMISPIEFITRAIISMAQSLSLDIVAEGIGTSDEKRVLEEPGCDEGQGFCFARPLTASAVIDGVKSIRHTPRR